MLSVCVLFAAWTGCQDIPNAYHDAGYPPREGPALPARATVRTCLAAVDVTLGTGAPMPETLSATGCFGGDALNVPAADMIPYDVNSPLWTDGAAKARYLVLPPGQVITYLPDGTLGFPVGTVLVKEFDMLMDERRPSSLRRLEVRFIMRGALDWGFFTYRFDDNGREAHLLAAGENEELRIRRDGTTQTFTYHFPSRTECMTCHSTATERALGFRIDQLNGLFDYTGYVENQLVAMHEVGVFNTLNAEPGQPPRPADYPALADPKDEGEDPERRARAYLHANCSHCHRPLGQSSPALTLDMRIERTLEDTHLCDEVQFFAPEGTLRIHPGDPDASFVVQRMESTDPFRQMPPLGRSLPDLGGGVRAVRTWAASLTQCP